MHLISINVGRRRHLTHRSFTGSTGIGKEPVATPVQVGPLGLAGDAVVNRKHHGGPDQAVYVYRAEDYAWWSVELGRPMAPGTFGDNLTVAGLPGAGAVIGSRLDFGSVELEITAPRIPCNTLAARMDDPGFVKRFMDAARPGFYCRVIRPGTLSAGAGCSLRDYPGAPVSTLEIFAARSRRCSTAELRRFLAAPIDERTRTDYLRQLAARDPDAPD